MTIQLFASRWRITSQGGLRASARLWLTVAVMGQWIFAAYIVLTYGVYAFRGELAAWNETLPHGYEAGNVFGNASLVFHLAFAAVITLIGALQLVPRLRVRFPALHRGLGRVYVFVALVMAATGLYLSLSGRRVVGGLMQQIATDINGVVIIGCAVMAWRRAVERGISSHRRWALRLFLVVNGVWFFRVGLMGWLLVNQGPVGFDMATFSGPFLTILNFAQFIVPLLVLELYLWMQEKGGTVGRAVVASGLCVLTLVTGLGIFAAAGGLWGPRLENALGGRKSVGMVSN